MSIGPRANFFLTKLQKRKRQTVPGVGYTTRNPLEGLMPQTLTLIAAMSPQPDSAQILNINAAITTLVASGAWTTFDLLYVLAAHSAQAAGLNWVNPGTYTLNPVNSPTFTTYRGYNSDGATSYLDTVWDPATNGVQFTQNSAHLGAYRYADGGSNRRDFGSSTTTYTGVRARSGTGGSATITGTTEITATAAVATPPVHVMGIRRVSTDILIWRDGAQDTTGAAVSSALTSVDFAFLKTANQFAGVNQITSAGHCGGAPDDTQALSIYNALHTYMVAVGADS